MSTLKRYARRSGEPAAAPAVCRHPEEKRIDASSMGHPDRWVCKCGYKHGFEETR